MQCKRRVNTDRPRLSPCATLAPPHKLQLRMMRCRSRASRAICHGAHSPNPSAHTAKRLKNQNPVDGAFAGMLVRPDAAVETFPRSPRFPRESHHGSHPARDARSAASDPVRLATSAANLRFVRSSLSTLPCNSIRLSSNACLFDRFHSAPTYSSRRFKPASSGLTPSKKPKNVPKNPLCARVKACIAQAPLSACPAPLSEKLDGVWGGPSRRAEGGGGKRAEGGGGAKPNRKKS